MMDNGIKFTLAPKSQMALPISTPPIMHGTVKLPGSLHLRGSVFWSRALHSSVSRMFPLSVGMAQLLLAVAQLCAKVVELVSVVDN
ncbi:hypothetical protein A2U01_0036331, partial [Trifolium medium]|nr:hypothetical protein [Trifolium medium]